MILQYYIAIYLCFILVYVSFRPIAGKEGQNTPLMMGLEITLWTMNLSYILFEVQEFLQKGQHV